MLIRVFKSNQNLINVLTLIFTAALWLPAFFIDSEIEFSHLLTTGLKWLDIIIAIILIAGQSIYLNVIVNDYKLVKDNSHLTSLMLVLVNSYCLFLLHLNQVLIANTFILIAFHQLLRMYDLKNNYSTLFNAAFLISLASLIYFPSITYFLLLWITLMYTTTPKWRDFIISLIGLSVPIIYLIVYKFISGNITEFRFSDYLTPIFDIHWTDFSQFSKICFIVFAVILLLSFMKLFSTLSSSIVRVKKTLIVIVLMFIIGLSTLFLNRFDYLATFLMISIPMAIILANFFQQIKKMWLAEIFFLCLLTSLALSYFS